MSEDGKTLHDDKLEKELEILLKGQGHEAVVTVVTACHKESYTEGKELHTACCDMAICVCKKIVSNH